MRLRQCSADTYDPSEININTIKYQLGLVGGIVFAEQDFDVDSDGVQEQCLLLYGMTSGIFTFEFRIIKPSGKQLYYGVFSASPPVTFKVVDVVLKIYEFCFDSMNQEKEFLTVSFDGERIILTDPDGEIRGGIYF